MYRNKAHPERVWHERDESTSSFSNHDKHTQGLQTTEYISNYRDIQTTENKYANTDQDAW